jgi:hypothetical protein
MAEKPIKRTAASAIKGRLTNMANQNKQQQPIKDGWHVVSLIPGNDAAWPSAEIQIPNQGTLKLTNKFPGGNFRELVLTVSAIPLMVGMIKAAEVGDVERCKEIAQRVREHMKNEGVKFNG